jgi:hypothetical protein
MNSLQDQLAQFLIDNYPDALVKKINKDNYLDIHLPAVHPKRGTHLFFNTASGVIKIGFYCREEEFTQQILDKSPELEAYNQGIRPKSNPEWKTVDTACAAAISFVESLSGKANPHSAMPAPASGTGSGVSTLFQRIKEVYPKCSLNQEKSYVSFTFKAAFLYELRIQKGIIRLLAANYPQKAPVEKCFELITRHQIAEKLIQDQFEIIVELGKVSPDKLTVRIEIPYKVQDLGSEAFHSKIIDCCDQFHEALMPLVNGFQSQPVGKLQEVMSDEFAPKSLELEEKTSQKSITFFEAIKAYKENKLDIVSKYVEQGNLLLQFNDEVLIENELISYVSASDALNSSIENLVNKGINLNDTTKNDACGYTAVHFAAWDNKADILEFLLEKGANPNAVGLEDGLTPLYLAAVNGNFASVELLLKYKADPNIVLNGEGLNGLKRYFSIDGGTALRGALVNFQFDIAFLLIKYGASKEELLKPCIASDFPTTNFINLLSVLGSQNPNSFDNDKYETLKSLIDGTQAGLLDSIEEEEKYVLENLGVGFPVLEVFKNDQPQEVNRAYLRKWQKPSVLYDWRKGIKVFIPDFVEVLNSDEVCPVFTNEQIKRICVKIKTEKVIPILSYAPDDFYYHTKRVWWIVPFCIWKDDIASMVFVDKDGFYALYETDGEVEINMIFSWAKVDSLEFEYYYHLDPFEEDDGKINRLTLYQEDGGYLTFDEFVSIEKEDDHGSYLEVIEAIWEARRETIEASRGESVWLEGEGGETFEEYEHPSEIGKSSHKIIAEKINKLKTIINFYIEQLTLETESSLTLETESSNSLEYVLRNKNLQHTSYIFDVNNDKEIEVYIKTTNEAYIKNAQNDGYLTKNFEWKDGLLKLIKSDSSFSDAFGAVKSFYDDILYLWSNGNINEVNSDTAYYIHSGYYGDHPFENVKYDSLANSLKDVKKLLLFRGDDVDVYLKVIKDINENAIDLLDSLFDLIRDEIEFRSQNNIEKVNVLDILSHCNELFEKDELSYDLHVKIIIALNDKYEGLKSISSSNEFIDFLEKNGNAVDAKIAYSSLSEHLKSKQAILHYLLLGTRKVFHLFPEEVKRDKVFVLSWINKVNEDLKQAEANKNSQPKIEEYLKVFETKNKSAGLAPHILTAVDDSLIGDEELLFAALSSKYVSFVEDLDPEKWAIDKEWAVKAAKINIHSVAYLPKHLKNDAEVCKALLAVHLSSFNFFEEEMKRNKVVQTFALKKDGYVFEIFPDDLKCNKDFIKKILDNCYDNDDYSGYMIFRVCEDLKNDQELIDLAVERNPSIFKEIVAPSNYTKDIFKHYLKVSPYILKLVPDEWQDDRDLMIALLSAGFDSHKRESLFKASAWFDDEAFALSLIQSSNYSYSLKYLREDFRIKPEIVHAFIQKFPEPEHIAVLPAKQLGVDFFRPLVGQNIDFLFFINNKEVADTLLENYKKEVLEKVKYIDLRFFDRMGALKDNSEVFKSFMTNPLISSRYLEQPGYYIEKDTSLMVEIGNLLVHFQLPFFDDRYNKGIDRKGLSFEHKNQERLKYIQSLSGEEAALFKLLLSDPCPEIREDAAKRIALDEEAFKEILDKGVPIVTHYEYGKSIVEIQKDSHVLRGLSMNPLY